MFNPFKKAKQDTDYPESNVLAMLKTCGKTWVECG